MVDAETSEDVRFGNSGHRKEAMKTDTLRLWAKCKELSFRGSAVFCFFAEKEFRRNGLRGLKLLLRCHKPRHVSEWIELVK